MVVLDGSDILFRLRGSLDLDIVFRDTKDDSIEEAIVQAMKRLRQKVASPSAVLRVEKSAAFVWPHAGTSTLPDQLKDDTPCCVLLQFSTDADETQKKLQGKRRERKIQQPLVNVKLLLELTRAEGTAERNPALHVTEHRGPAHLARLRLDVLSTCPALHTWKIAVGALMQAVEQQLYEAEEHALRFRCFASPRGGATAVLVVPEPLHFVVPRGELDKRGEGEQREGERIVTVMLPAGVGDESLIDYRRELHARFLLPADRPLFRRANVHTFPDEQRDDGYLRSPHLGLRSPQVENVKIQLVQGTYTYHHYMQERVDDKGWGCAYRSLQTICSWFKQQGYTQRAVPSHRDIQQALMDTGDKSSSFVGSRQWIGSIEVQTVLNQLLNVTSKIMFISKGSEMASTGRELSMHFENEGTPVMIGGGLLAHTIVGVAWSESSGQIRFLILDPHYTGAEDLSTVQDKGWCGWKGPDFWDRTVYYNMCLPLRPREL
ncbi:ufm1-specific protease 2 isoform X2 [Lethenteron reissneri]|uniref:ufm1-specific protease 2 isoform X2 n=1 Tax=Lethenteron reissneri TaxID=7753 RepID=UPI002AB76D1B|nr:ufm1-specific protease 2 isoform X2 [Lethenteron reissneri]